MIILSREKYSYLRIAKKFIINNYGRTMRLASRTYTPNVKKLVKSWRCVMLLYSILHHTVFTVYIVFQNKSDGREERE